jgi:hypothetical protein
MDDENLLLRVLKFATERDGFTFQELCVAIEPTDDQRKYLIEQIHIKNIRSSSHHDFKNYFEKLVVTLRASCDDHFRYLEY